MTGRRGPDGSRRPCWGGRALYRGRPRSRGARRRGGCESSCFVSRAFGHDLPSHVLSTCPRPLWAAGQGRSSQRTPRRWSSGRKPLGWIWQRFGFSIGAFLLGLSPPLFLSDLKRTCFSFCPPLFNGFPPGARDASIFFYVALGDLGVLRSRGFGRVGWQGPKVGDGHATGGANPRAARCVAAGRDDNGHASGPGTGNSDIQ